MEHIVNKLSSIIDIVLRMVFPQKCLGCRENNTIICKDCLQKIEKHNSPIDTNIYAIYSYKNPIIKKAIWNLKYHHQSSVGNFFGEILYNKHIEDISDIYLYNMGQKIIIIPVPLHKKRLKERGYNQAEIIARSFCKSSEKNIFEIDNKNIIKKFHTQAQAKILNKKKRLHNARGAYLIKDKSKFKNRIIIVIDDVTTTGGTFIEIKKILEKAGARKIFCYAIAH